jgi:hypothetical protein
MRTSTVSLPVIWYIRFSTPGIRIVGVPSVHPYPVVYALPRKLAILDVQSVHARGIQKYMLMLLYLKDL